jgi:hypothetical protein
MMEENRKKALERKRQRDEEERVKLEAESVVDAQAAKRTSEDVVKAASKHSSKSDMEEHYMAIDAAIADDSDMADLDGLSFD